jgi:transposase-like protein
LSAQAFCRLKGLSASNFSTWRKRLREEGASASGEPATFIPLEVTARDSSFSLLKDSTQNQQPTFSSDIILSTHQFV